MVLHGGPRLSPPEARAFTTTGTLVLLQAQLVMVVAVAPALAVSSVAEEKDQQTLPLLLLTEWSDGEIVRGKAVARVGFLLVALSGGWPVVWLLQCVGPLESGLVATGWCLTVGTAALCTALGIYAACRTDDFQSAVVHAYVLVAVGVSGAIAGERERHTLETLLATAFQRRSVLRAKVQAQVERGTGLAAVAVTAVGMAITADHGIRLGSMAAVLMMAGMVLVVAAGAWLTVRCARKWRAFRFLFPVAMLSVIWPWGVKAVLQYGQDVSSEEVFRGLVVLSTATMVAAGLFWWLAERKIDGGDCY